ncbi:hypothetical protein [uncultured Alistipes sp.]|uniref:hypothetical protein n=1 Tax=uncultured Alistipes sp. TaxID=538949 RepID=UPI002639B16C|nr:hypothetical protein [uncultured Alistipes sp.]
MDFRNLIRQPLPVATLTFLLIVVAAFVRAVSIPYFSGTAPARCAPLGEYTLLIRESAPVAALVASLFMLIWAGLLIGRNTVRAELYAQRCFLAMPLFGIASCAIVLSSDFLTQSLVLLLLTMASRNFYNSFHRHYCFDRIFRGALCIGLIPLLYAPGIGLWLLIPIVIRLFRRTLRESIVAIAGLLLPLFFAGFIYWAVEDDFTAPYHRITEALSAPCGSLFFGENTLPILTAWGLILFLLFCAAALLLFNVYQLRTKPRNILLYNLCLFCITVGIYFFPGSTAITPALAAPAIATLLPVVLTRINGIAASIFYLVILLLSLLPGLI